MIRVAIVEDDAVHAERLQQNLERYGKERTLEFWIDFFNNGMDFVSDYKANYEIIFMDIEMPYMNGMDCAVRLRRVDRDVTLIFVTSMVQYAVKGYEVGAMGYIVKPLNYFPFSVMMDKVVEKIKSDVVGDLFVGSGGSAKRISVRDLHYIEVLDHYLIYHTSEGEFREIGKISETELQLGSADFFRISNSFLVNLRYVREISENEVTVGKDRLFISRRRKKDFLLALNAYFKKGRF